MYLHLSKHSTGHTCCYINQAVTLKLEDKLKTYLTYWLAVPLLCHPAQIPDEVVLSDSLASALLVLSFYLCFVEK